MPWPIIPLLIVIVLSVLGWRLVKLDKMSYQLNKGRMIKSLRRGRGRKHRSHRA